MVRATGSRSHTHTGWWFSGAMPHADGWVETGINRTRLSLATGTVQRSLFACPP